MLVRIRARSRRAVRCFVLAAGTAVAMSSASWVHGQTSGTWAADVGTAGGSWSNPANWVNGNVAGDGGVARFPTLSTFTTAPVNVFQDLPNLTLDGIVFDTFITYALARPAGNTTNVIELAGPAELRHNRPSINAWNTLFSGQFLSIPIAGNSGMNKTGPGTVSITQPNTFTGGMTITDGMIRTTVGDAAFGDASNSIIMINAQIRTASGALNSARTFNVTGVGTIETTAGNIANLTGQIIGAGDFNKSGSARMDLGGTASNTGAFNIHAGSLVINGNGAVTAASSIRAVGTITLDSAAVNHTNRLNDSTPITFAGSGLMMVGNASSGSSETIGAATFGSGLSFLTVTPGAGQSASISAGAAGRENGGAAFFRGSNLGASSGPGVAQFTFANVALSGGGGAAGTSNISIIPWAYGSTSDTAAANAANNSLVTHGPTGVRPLDLSTEYINALAPGSSADNVRIASAQAVNAPATVNALVIASGGSVTGTGTLTLTSGALLNLAANTSIANPLDFGNTEGMLHAPANITLSGAISGSGGLSKSSGGNATFANASSTYTGTTTLGGGTNTFLTSVPAGAPSPFGADTSPVILAGGNFTSVRLEYAGAGSASFDRDLINNSANAQGNQALLPRFGVAGSQTLVMNGDIELNFPLAITGTAGAHVILNGNISGGTFLTDTSTAITITLNGNNTHAGMELLTGTFNVGSDTALGSGMVKMAGLGTAPSIAALGGPRIVPNDVASLRFGGNYWQVVGSEDITFTGSINLGGSFPHVINNTALTTYAGVLHTGGFTKGGTGTLVLSGDNIYTGTTTISSGVLRITHANALGSIEAPTIIAQGATLELAANALSQEPVRIAGGSGGNTGWIRSTNGHNQLGPISIESMANIGVDSSSSLHVDRVERTPALGWGSLTVSGGGVLSAERYRLGFLSISGETTVRVTPGRDDAKTSVTGGLSLAPDARLDLADNDLVVDHTSGASQLLLVRERIASAYAGGAWTGAGITSSAASASTRGLGYAQSAELFTTFPATFSGVSVDDTSVLVRWTRYGDADLSGTVNLADFNRLAANFGSASVVWSMGDFNYDGLVNLADFNLLAANFGLQAGPEGPTPDDWSNLASAVPEPSLAIVTGVAALAAMSQRRQRRHRV